MNNSERVLQVSIFKILSLPKGEEQNIEMEIMETGGKFAGIGLGGGAQPAKNEFLIKRGQDYAKSNPMSFPVRFKRFSLLKNYFEA
jgi:hypothetical protein